MQARFVAVAVAAPLPMGMDLTSDGVSVLPDNLKMEAAAALPIAIAGVDEVGRGALFGPVVAAAVILPPTARAALAALGVTDSKRLSDRRRRQLVTPIKTLAANYAIGLGSVHDIERLNILGATWLAMTRAITQLSPTPSLCLVDGNRPIPNLTIPQQAVTRGDQTHIEIAAASILAKVWRDTLITRLDSRYPGYGLAQHKGYGSAMHRHAIQALGPTSQHRRSFKGCQGEGSSQLDGSG